MNPVLLRSFANRCRDLMHAARTTAAKEQLGLWVDEFETRAEALEREPAEEGFGNLNPNSQARSTRRK
jgi:hypothetical protein